jgi:tetratricopeptide (TPR) repeat protein
MIRSSLYACAATIAFTAWLIVSASAQQQSQADDDVARLRQQAIKLQLARKTDEAIQLYRQALALAEQRLHADDRVVVQLIEDLAYAYYEPGRRPEAEAFYLRLLSVYDVAGGQQAGKLWLALRRLEDLYRSQGRQNDAAPLEARARALETGVAKPFSVVIPAQSIMTSDVVRVRLNDCGVIAFDIREPGLFLMSALDAESARARITTLLNSGFRRILGSMTFEQIRGRPDAVTDEIKKLLDLDVRSHGISVSTIAADFRACVVRDAS